MLHERLASLRRAGEVGDGVVDVEHDGVRQRSDFIESPIRPVPLAAGHARLPGGAGQPGHQREHDQRGGDDRGSMATDEARQPVTRGRAAGHHGKPFQVAADVLGELVHRAVAPRGVLVERLEHHEVEVAGQAAPQSAGGVAASARGLAAG